MRSRLEEIAALKELLIRTEASATQESINELVKVGVPKETLAGIKITNDTKDQNGAICMLVRGRLIMPKNKTGPCAGCGETIQWRPHLADELEKLCAFCALRRTRGDA